MALDVNNVVSVTVNVSPKAASSRGFGQCLIIGTSDVIPAEERIRYYASLTEVGADFAVDTDEYKMASTYFSQNPTPAQLAIGYWNNKQLGTKTVAKGSIIEDIKSLFVDGAMRLTYDGTDYDLNIDCSTCSTMEQVLSLLSASFILEGTGTPFIPGTPQVDEVKNSISAKDTLSDDEADFTGYGASGSFTLYYKDGSSFQNVNCENEFTNINGIKTLQTALNSGLVGANVTVNLLEKDDTGKYYLNIVNNADVVDDGKNIVSIAFTGVLEDKMGTQNGFDVVDYVPFKAVVPDKEAVPAEYFANAVYKDDVIQIVPIAMEKAITLPVKSTEYPDLADFSVLMGFDKGKIAQERILEESAEEIVSIMADTSQSWYGCMFAVALQDDEILATSKLIEGLSPVRVIGHTLQSPDEVTSKESIGSLLKSAGLRRTMCQYDPNNRYAVASYMARLCTINFNANNTVITMKFKQEPTVSSLELTTSQANNLRSKNINCFVEYSNDTAIIQEGTQMNGDWSDEVIGLDWLQNYIQTSVFNILYTSTTKIPQTNQGATMLLSAVNNALERAKNNGLLAPGVWNSIDVGSISAGSYLANGYYAYIQDISTQSQADRENRKAPPIQCAVKLGGAFHNADVIVNVER